MNSLSIKFSVSDLAMKLFTCGSLSYAHFKMFNEFLRKLQVLFYISLAKLLSPELNAINLKTIVCNFL